MANGEPIYWIDPYEDKKDKELQAYRTCVIDGYGWQTAPSGRRYCAGKVEDLLKELDK